MTATFRNETDEAVTLDTGPNDVGYFKMALRKPDGTIVTVDPGYSHPSFRGDGNLHSLGRRDVPLHQQASQDILLNEWFDFDEAGAYTLAVNFVGSPDLPIDRLRQVGFTILPRDEKALGAACERLITLVRTATDFDTAHRATRTLTFVKDPLVVSYLTRVIEPGKAIPRLGPEESLAVLALEEMGEYEALRHVGSGNSGASIPEILITSRSGGLAG